LGVSLQFEVHFDADGQGLWNVGAEGEILRTSPRGTGYDAQSWGSGCRFGVGLGRTRGVAPAHGRSAPGPRGHQCPEGIRRVERSLGPPYPTEQGGQHGYRGKERWQHRRSAPATRATPVGGRRHLARPHGALDGSQHKSAGDREHHREGRPARVRAGDDRCAPYRLDLCPADPALQPRRQRLRVRRRVTGSTGGCRLRVGAHGDLHLLRGGDGHGVRDLRRGLSGQPRHLDGPAGMGAVCCRRGGLRGRVGAGGLEHPGGGPGYCWSSRPRRWP
jgi:hypothetical protein